MEMWPRIEMCASVALAGEFLVIARSTPRSHACRMIADSVFPSRLNDPQCLGELRLDDQEPLVGHAGVINHGLVAGDGPGPSYP